MHVNVEIPASEVLQKLIEVIDDGRPLDFSQYHIYKTLIDMPPVNELILRTGRQVGKSTFLATKLIQYAFIPSFRMTYIAPRDKQLREFSRMKLGIILSFNPKLKHMLLNTKSPLAPEGVKLSHDMILNDVYSKLFATGSSLKLGFAADAMGVDRIRGGSADALMFDEAQSIDLDSVLPVVSPLLASSAYGFRFFTGTPLNDNDPLCVRYDNSSQHTMIIKCPHCNKYTTLFKLEQISEKGILCAHCWGVVSVRDGVFHPMNPKSNIFGVHINRIMFPMTSEEPNRLNRLLQEIKDPNQSPDKLMQEVMGIASGAASRLITEEDIKALSRSDITYTPGDILRSFPAIRNTINLVYSIDWGGGADPLGKIAKVGGESHTAVMLWKIEMKGNRSRMRLLYHKVFPLENPRASLDEIVNDILLLPQGSIVAADALGGTFGNASIRDAIYKRGVNIRFVPIQLGETNETVKLAPTEDRVVVSRSVLITKLFRKMAPLKEMELPGDTKLINDLVSHFLAEVEFENEIGKRIWRKRAGGIDDLLFCTLFAWVAYNYVINNLPELVT